MNPVEIWHNIRFHTTFSLHMLLHKLKWYRRWHGFKWHRHAHAAILLVYIISVIAGSAGLFTGNGKALAASQSWAFNEGVPSNYYSYGNEISVGGGSATLASHTPGTDWISVQDGYNWNYRKAFTITNPNNSSAYQVQLTGVDTVLGGKVQANCSDLTFTGSDGVTVIPHWVESATCPAASTSIWVKVPAGQTTVYMYYGSSHPEWTPRATTQNWNRIASSADGTKLAAVVNGGQIYTSTDSGITWTARAPSQGWYSIASSADGTKLAAVVQNGQIYTFSTTNSDTNTFEKVINNVQGAWQMDGNGNDSSGNGYNTYDTGCVGPNYPNGHFNQALQPYMWDCSEALGVSNTTAPKLNITNNLSISAWVYTTAANAYQTIVDKGNYNGAYIDNYRFMINNTGQLNFSWQHGDGVWHIYGANTVLTLNTWHHVAITYANPNGAFYLDGNADGTFSDANAPTASAYDLSIGVSGPAGSEINPFSGSIDELKIYNTSILTQADITALADSPSQNHYSYFSPTLHPNMDYLREYSATAPTMGSIGSEQGYYYNDNPTIQNQAGGNGLSESYISAMSIATGGTGSVRFQISPDNGTTWYMWNGSAWAAITNPDTYDAAKTNAPSDVTANIASFRPGGANPKNFRWRAFLVSDGTQTATITSVSLTYVTDTGAPNNPDISGVTAYQSDGGATWTYDPTQLWHNYAAPKFAWTAPSDPIKAGETESSGVWEYYAKMTTNASYTPTSADATTNNYLVAPTLTNGQTYYLRISTVDNAQNVAAPTTLLTYKYDNVAPAAPTSISVNTLEYTTNPVTVTWSGSSDADSGVDHYIYQKYAGDTWTSIAASPASGIVGKEGKNTFSVEAVDKAGNVSAPKTIDYYYTANPPGAPTNLQVDSQSKINDNNFTFTWDAPPVNPNTNSPIAGYYYSINTIPLPGAATKITGSQPTGNTVSLGGTQQGVNTFYVATYDQDGRVNYSNYAWIQFEITTTAPNAPQMVAISDVSDRRKPDYALAISWKQPDNYNQNTFGHYTIRRSTTQGLSDAQWQALAPVGTASTPAYAEASLTKGTTYYYRITAVDNAGAESSLSSVVSLAPTGKYITPPTVVSGPGATATATSATVTWSTDRSSYSMVEYGKDTGYGMQNSSLQTVTSHSVTLYGLDPGAVYHFRIQSLDPADQKDYDDSLAYSTDETFSTQPAPGISEVKISDISLSGAIVSWKTTSSSPSTIKYGKTNSYGSELSDSSGSAVTTHTVKLSNLSDSSTYHFKIFGTDTDGNVMQSDDYNFDTLTFPKISNVKYEQLNGNNAGLKVIWDSNVPTTSTVNYSGPGGQQEVYKADLVLSHEIITPHLADNSNYTISVSGRDAYGNETVPESQAYKTAFDTTPPVISDITTETSISGFGAEAKSQIIVSWNTDEPATSQVEYAKGVSGDAYGMSTKEDDSLTTSHVVVVSDLDPSSSYYFRVVSKDASKNEAKSDENSALTEQAQSSIFDLVLRSFETTLGWMFGG